MKMRILTACVLIILFFIGIFCFIEKPKYETYKILKVIEADTFYIDINKNDNIEEDEFFKLKDIIALTPIKNGYSEQVAKNHNIPIETYIKTGYVARLWAKEHLEGREVVIKTDFKNKTKYIEIEIDNNDLGEILLRKGLALVHNKSSNSKYFQTENIKQIKNNASELSILKFLLLNKKTNLLHALKSEHFEIMKSGELILEKNSNSPDFKFCPYCVVEKMALNYDFPKSKNKYPTSISKKFGDIELYLLNPLQFKKPDNTCRTEICKKLINEINLSNKSIDIALYGVGEFKDIINALNNAKERGVEIRLVLDMSNNTSLVYPFNFQLAQDFDGKFDDNNTLMHNKFMIFDNKKVMTGSTNFSSTGLGGYNANLVLFIDSEEVSKIYTEEFNQMYLGKFSKNKSKIEKEKILLSESEISIYFSPKDDYKNEIIELIKNAKSEIIVSSFYLTQKDLIEALKDAKKRGLNVLILSDAVAANNFRDKIKFLRNSNIPLKVENWGGKNHEKTILIDDEYLITGSCNFTNSGFYKNDENSLIIKNKQIAQFYRDYFLYLFNSIDNKFLKFIPRAESLESVNSCYDGIDNNFDGLIDGDDEGCKIKSKNH